MVWTKVMLHELITISVEESRNRLLTEVVPVREYLSQQLTFCSCKSVLILISTSFILKGGEA